MSSLMRTTQRGIVPDLLDWFDNPFATLRTNGNMVRFEEFTEDGRYVLRAELPGINPDEDVEITVNNGVLTVSGERREEEKDEYRSEFRYGSFKRSTTLPEGADPDDVKATYDKGVLEVSVAVHEPEAEKSRRISISKS